jgi:hypothetical protein
MMARFEVQEMVPWKQRFLAMLPCVLRFLGMAFRMLPPEAKSEAVQEGVVNSFFAYSQLVKRGKENLAFGSVLARFAVSQIRAGRRVGGRLNVQDISSAYAQKRKRFRLERLDRFDPTEGCWKEAVVEDYRTPVADQACFRIDFLKWLESLPPRDRKIAAALADGNRTTDVARRFGFTPGRVSQLRRKFERSWLEFHGEEAAESQRMELLQAA